jgi:hypothetical protein
MVLPIRGTGLVTGTARKVRGAGTPLTDIERLERHYSTGSDLDGVVFLLASLAATGLLIWATTRR